MKKFVSLLIGATALLSASAPSSAAVIAQVFADDDIYQMAPYTGTINDTDFGAAAVRSFSLAVYYDTFTINLTDMAGTITNILSTAGEDVLVFQGRNSGAAGIGTACTTSASVACVVSTGAIVDLTAIVTAFNQGSGICCSPGLTYLRVQTADEVPEPAMLGLFGLGAIGLGLARRKRG